MPRIARSQILEKFRGMVQRGEPIIGGGAGTGVSGGWLLRGMRRDGVLTTIDLEAEHQRIARRVFAAAGNPPSRTRIITGSVSAFGRCARFA